MNDPAQFLAAILLTDGLLILAWWLMFDRDPKDEPQPVPDPVTIRGELVICDQHDNPVDTYILHCRLDQKEAAMEAIRRWASNPELQFSGTDEILMLTELTDTIERSEWEADRFRVRSTTL